MSDAPKCKSWLGHKFEARYSSQPDATLTGFRAEAVFARDIPKLMTKQTYECDVCIRCGYVVQQPQKAS